jgi:RHS repeat-associated protein
MTRQTDAMQQRVEFAHDAAGRLSTRNTYVQGGALVAAVTMSYSQARAGHFNKGRLTTVSGPGTTALEMDYNARGRVEKRRRTLDGVTHALRTLYDAGDRLLSMQFPDLDTYVYQYDGAGRPRAVNAVLNNVLWDARGRPTVQTNANGTVTTWTYSPERGFLTAIHTSGPGTPPVPQDLQYVSDPAGIVESVASPFADESWSYEYDDLYHLTSASGLTKSQTWTYDAEGRILTNSRVGSYTYTGWPFHAPITAGGNSYNYDPNGQLLSGGGRTLTWNADNRLAQANSTQFVYDEAGERLKKTTGSNVSRYPFGDDYEITNGVTTKYFVVPGLGVIGKRVSGSGTAFGCSATLDGFYWFHKDRLGSIQAVTNASACEVKRRTYRAYGETIAQTGTHAESRGWIDQRQDIETGLTYLHARSYDSLLGLFVSPDPEHPTRKGVGINRFAYSFSNPVNFSDRSGLESIMCVLHADKAWHCGFVDSVGVSPDELPHPPEPEESGWGTWLDGVLSTLLGGAAEAGSHAAGASEGASTAAGVTVKTGVAALEGGKILGQALVTVRQSRINQLCAVNSSWCGYKGQGPIPRPGTYDPANPPDPPPDPPEE